MSHTTPQGSWSPILSAFTYNIHADTWLAYPMTNTVQIYTAHDTDTPSRMYISDGPIKSLRDFNRALDAIMDGTLLMYERVTPLRTSDDSDDFGRKRVIL